MKILKMLKKNNFCILYINHLMNLRDEYDTLVVNFHLKYKLRR